MFKCAFQIHQTLWTWSFACCRTVHLHTCEVLFTAAGTLCSITLFMSNNRFQLRVCAHSIASGRHVFSGARVLFVVCSIWLLTLATVPHMCTCHVTDEALLHPQPQCTHALCCSNTHKSVKVQRSPKCLPPAAGEKTNMNTKQKFPTRPLARSVHATSEAPASTPAARLLVLMVLLLRLW